MLLRRSVGLFQLLLAGIVLPLLAAGVVVETPLPLGQLRNKPPPRGYVAQRCAGALVIDGLLDEPCWAAAAATDEFVDIVGPSVQPWVSTTAKMLWDDSHLYIAAELEDPRAFAYESKHDSIIFHDNDFEVFIDPDGDSWAYTEVEVNARGAVWDLLLVRPYRNGGPPVMNYETIAPAVPTTATGPTGWRPMHVAVRVTGSLNTAEGSTGWTVEMALPWSLLQQAANRQVPPAHGDKWRINFSRVHYNVTWSEQQQRYVKDPPDQPGYNFVWSPQWQVQMHQPETWGYVQFSRTPVSQASGTASSGFSPDPTWPARALLMDVYHAQTLCWQALGRFCRSLREASAYVDFADVADQHSVVIETTKVSFVASTQVQLEGGSRVVVMVDQLSRLVQTPAAASAGGRLPQFNPFEGTSHWQLQPPQAAGSTSQPAAGQEASSTCLQLEV